MSICNINFISLILVHLAALVFSCTTSPKTTEISRSQQVEQTARDFFDTFADRSDWKKFCSFYREDVKFEDVMLQIRLDSLWQLKKFYNWESEVGNFQKLTPDQNHITIKTLVANDSVAVAYGHLNPFYYFGELKDAEWGMDVTFWLYFDENLKIKKQIDWLEYEPEVHESTIAHFRKNGVDKLPEWLDLSR